MLKITKLSSHHNKAIILLGTIIGLIIAQPFIWSIVMKNADSLQKKKSQQEQITGVNQRADDIIQTLAEQRDALSQIDAVIVPANQVTQIVEKVEKIADDLKIDINISAITEPEKTSDVTDSIFPSSVTSLALSQMTISLRLIGPIDAILRYLDRIEHLAEFTVVPSWSIKPVATTSQAQPTTTPIPAITNQTASSFTLQLNVIFFVRN